MSILFCTFAASKVCSMNTAMIEQIRDYFATQPVLKAWLFGSYARGEERPDSDVDLLVKFDREHAKVGLLKYAAIIIDLEKMLNKEVDLVEDGALMPYAERTANKDKKLIYERENLKPSLQILLKSISE